MSTHMFLWRTRENYRKINMKYTSLTSPPDSADFILTKVINLDRG